MLKKILIVISTFIISIQPVNADKSKIHKKVEKINDYQNKKISETNSTSPTEVKEEIIKQKNMLVKHISIRIDKTKKKTNKKLKNIQHKLTGFFSDLPEMDKK